MIDFFKKHGQRLKTVSLILMLVIPFLLYAAASHDSVILVNLLIGLMGADMLYVMFKG
jgi:hypothetical protein